MALPTSGVMSASMINVELLRPSTAPFSIGASAERTLAGKLNGAIAFSDFYGKAFNDGGRPLVWTAGSGAGNPNNIVTKILINSNGTVSCKEDSAQTSFPLYTLGRWTPSSTPDNTQCKWNLISGQGANSDSTDQGVWHNMANWGSLYVAFSANSSTAFVSNVMFSFRRVNSFGGVYNVGSVNFSVTV